MADGMAERNPWWPMGLGATLIVLALVCVWRAFLSPADNMVLIGVLMLVAGGAEGLHAVFGREWRDFVTDLAPGLLYVLVGGTILASPLSGAFVLTLVMAAAFVTGVVWRIAVSLRDERPGGWTMLAVAAVVTLVVWGLLVWAWPASARWVLGAVAAAGLLVAGIGWIRRGMAARAEHETL
ncbi:DUF308 domain-containing protein [Alsobacter sp. SYSU M60028]|uniref:DUF308 domain-containing protein n=1 Tax=Alsobacter ponti TaxID=2962936 RepID=A0ABT1LD01_9HYPH|nr:DUF308 domain-containing protein [Alsobacter ponti]MCP8938966.1 DUF308 domain-containing protein [Alsobacter ponti]